MYDLSKQYEEFPLYLKVVLVSIAILVALTVYVLYADTTNYAKENNYIENADCNSLKHYVDAGRLGKDYFAVWTSESQETINFKINNKNVDKAQMKYMWECNQDG